MQAINFKKLWNHFVCEELNVDDRISELLEELWWLDIETTCWGVSNNEYVSIELYDFNDMEKLSNIIFENQKHDDQLFDDSRMKWRMSVIFHDNEECLKEDNNKIIRSSYTGRVSLNIRLQWIFPIEHYIQILTRIKEYYGTIHKFVYFAKTNNLNELKNMVNNGFDKIDDCERELNYNALMIACRNGNKDVVNYLLDNFADINKKNIFGKDALKILTENKSDNFKEIMNILSNKKTLTEC